MSRRQRQRLFAASSAAMLVSLAAVAVKAVDLKALAEPAAAFRSQGSAIADNVMARGYRDIGVLRRTGRILIVDAVAVTGIPTTLVFRADGVPIQDGPVMDAMVEPAAFDE